MLRSINVRCKMRLILGYESCRLLCALPIIKTRLDDSIKYEMEDSTNYELNDTINFEEISDDDIPFGRRHALKPI